METRTQHHWAVREAAWFSILLFIGLVIAPIAIYLVGRVVFGEFAGAGYTDFFGRLSGRVRSGNLAAWFLVLSPWLGVQLIRLLALGWRSTRR